VVQKANATALLSNSDAKLPTGSSLWWSYFLHSYGTL